MANVNTVARSARIGSAERLRHLIQVYGTLGVLILLMLYDLLSSPRLHTFNGLLQAITVNLTQVAPTAIIATGMTLVIATGGIDLSVGSLMAIAGALSPLIFLSTVSPLNNPLIGFTLALIVPFLVVGLLGLFNGILVTTFRIQPIIATLVLFISGRGLAQVVSNGKIQVFSNPIFQFIGGGSIIGIPFQVIVMVLIVVLFVWIMRSTTFGRYILAIGGNEEAARLAGIPVSRVKRSVYVISALLAGVAGLFIIAINSSSDATNVGLNGELDAIAAVAVGGTSLAGGRATVLGTLIGALLIQIIHFTLVSKNVPSAAAQVINAVIIIIAVYLQRQRKA
ncbi:MAG: ABC transporter permease [Ktedonobacteraceae bacterium]